MFGYGLTIYTYVVLVAMLMLWSAYGHPPRRMEGMALRFRPRRQHAQQQSLGSLQAERWQH